jgi:hypothetical protein
MLSSSMTPAASKRGAVVQHQGLGGVRVCHRRQVVATLQRGVRRGADAPVGGRAGQHNVHQFRHHFPGRTAVDQFIVRMLHPDHRDDFSETRDSDLR